MHVASTYRLTDVLTKHLSRLWFIHVLRLVYKLMGGGLMVIQGVGSFVPRVQFSIGMEDYSLNRNI